MDSSNKFRFCFHSAFGFIRLTRAIIILLVIISSLQLHGQITPNKLRAMAYPMIRDVMMRESIKGLSMALVTPDFSPILQGFGYADFDEQKLVHPNTAFPLASLTKSFTSIAIMNLVEQGILNLSDPVVQHLPEFEIKSRYEFSREILISDLLSHFGGLPRDLYKGLISLTKNRPYLLEYLSGQYVTFPPGVKHSYSNLGYELLGLLIERVSGIPYEQYVQEEILKPLGMHQSRFYSQGLEGLELSRAYVSFDYDTYEEYPLQLSASGGLLSNAHDLSLMLEWMLFPGESEPNISDTLLKRLFTDQKPPGALDVSLQSSWSWILEALPQPFSGNLAYQMGTTLHFSSVIALIPEYEVGIVLLSNTSGTNQALADLSREIILNVVESKTGLKISPQPEKGPLPVVVTEPEIADRFRGDFLLEESFFQVFNLHGDLILKSGVNVFHLFSNPDGWFTLNPDTRLQVREVNGSKVLFVEQKGFIFPAGTDIRRIYNLPQDIESRLGSYLLMDVNPQEEEVFYKQLDLFLEDDLLQVALYVGDHQSHIFGLQKSRYHLIPTPEGNAIFAGFGVYKGETLFLGEDDKGQFVSFSGLRFNRTLASE